jgi:hypothetical protein
MTKKQMVKLCRNILITAKLQIGRRGKKTALTGSNPFR